MSRVRLFDVEGTTTAIDFVHQTLFPYSRQRMATFVRDHAELAVVRKLQAAHGTIEQVIAQLDDWIQEDKKVGELKELQGLIWDEGYRRGDFQGHVYPDVRPAFEAWHAEGVTLAIYSSGSVHAQRCIFGFSTAGDLTPLISSYFDTTTGPKREPASYLRIAEQLRVPAHEVTFYSDIREELDAAQSAGLRTVQVFRQAPPTNQGHRCVVTFLEAPEEVEE